MKVVNENLDLMAKLMTASTKRHAVHASNIANINTPNYKAKQMNFEESFRAAYATPSSRPSVAVAHFRTMSALISQNVKEQLS